MAKQQGYNRIMNGFVKKITKSERNRGYLFISIDKLIKEELGSTFPVQINKEDRWLREGIYR